MPWQGMAWCCGTRAGPARLAVMRLEMIRRLIRRSRQSLWLRPAIYGAVAVATLALAPLVAPMVPAELVKLIGLDGVYDLLSALANTLLAVAIFSLGIMVSSIHAAAQVATPRARPLLMKDRTAQNAISTFIGGFIYAIVGIVGLSTSYFNDAARVILFFASCVVVSAVILALIRWIGRLSSLGDVAEVIDRLETTSVEAIDRLAADPFFGGHRAVGRPEQGVEIFPESFGYLQAIDGGVLGDVSDGFDGDLHVLAQVGMWIDPSRPLLCCGAVPDEEATARLRGAFSIGAERQFDDDPAFGLVVLAEIASRALSTGENDPGTALDVIATSVRVLSQWSDRTGHIPKVRHPRLFVAAIEAPALLEDAFRWIARDGAGQLEVLLRLADGLAALAAHDPRGFGTAARAMAGEILSRAEAAMQHRPDVDELRRRLVQLGLTAA